MRSGPSDPRRTRAASCAAACVRAAIRAALPLVLLAGEAAAQAVRPPSAPAGLRIHTGQTSAPSPAAPWTVTRRLPGTIQAEDFDAGANGIAYSDSTAGNTGAQYRTTDVDIQACSEGGYNVGWSVAGEWLNYTVTVAAAGTYNVDFRVASAAGGRLRVTFNGQDGSGGVVVPVTGGWQTWTTVRTTATLSAGSQVMRVLFDTGNVNLHAIRVEATSTEPSPAPGGRLRVATWNVSFGAGNFAGQAQEIANTGADVVLLQEASTSVEDMPSTYPNRLRQITGQPWYSVWAPHGGRYGPNEGTLILSRLPLADTSTMNAYDRGFSRVLVSVGGVQVNLFSIHLDWSSTTARSAQLQEFMAWSRGFAGPRIAGGDFNAWWGEWWITQMETEHTDTWQDVTGSDQNGYTLNGTVRFDYLFRAHDQSSRLQPTGCWVHATTLSDHRPVVADYLVR